MTRIFITGNAGSGKTTLAKESGRLACGKDICIDRTGSMGNRRRLGYGLETVDFVTVETPYGVVTAHWHREGRRMILIRFGERVKREKASDNDATNDFVARDVLRYWVAEDLKGDEDTCRTTLDK